MDSFDIVHSALASFERRRSFTPGMFEPLTPLLKKLGYDTAAIYIVDDYPDRMTLAAGYGGAYPPSIMLGGRVRVTPAEAAETALRGVPGLMVERLFNHGRELGVIAATVTGTAGKAEREELATLAGAVSVMAYGERVRTNTEREREEREIFFAQALISRLLVRDVPKIKHLRLGCEHVRSLEAGGDFFDFIARPDGSLLGFVGSCSGSGLRTVLEVCCIMREIQRSLNRFDRPSQVLDRINTFLVEEKRRRHQASLCVFRVSAVERRITIAKSGRLGALLSDPGGRIENVSAPGANFLGIMPHLDFHDEEHGFEPGQSLFCVTEGFYIGRDLTNGGAEQERFFEYVSAALAARRKKPLANAVFDAVNREGNPAFRPDNPMLALSVEFLNNRESVRLIRESGRFNKS